MIGMSINTYMPAMPINQKSPNIRIFFSDEEKTIKNQYKVFCAQIEQSMSSRLKSFVEKELEYWRKYGEPIDIEKIGREKELKQNGHSPQHKRLDDPWGNAKADDDYELGEDKEF